MKNQTRGARFEVTASVLLSSIFLPTYLTFTAAVLQFTGIILVLKFSPSDAALNWFGFLAFVFLTSMFSLLANNIIQLSWYSKFP